MRTTSSQIFVFSFIHFVHSFKNSNLFLRKFIIRGNFYFFRYIIIFLITIILLLLGGSYFSQIRSNIDLNRPIVKNQNNTIPFMSSQRQIDGFPRGSMDISTRGIISLSVLVQRLISSRPKLLHPRRSEAVSLYSHTTDIVHQHFHANESDGTNVISNLSDTTLAQVVSFSQSLNLFVTKYSDAPEPICVMVTISADLLLVPP